MNWLSNVLKAPLRAMCALSPSCKEAARLQSAALDRPLTLSEKFGLSFHLFFCNWCRRYGKQINFLRSAARQYEPEDQSSTPPALSSEARERIKQRLQSEKQ
jgi:hypothetical protein